MNQQMLTFIEVPSNGKHNKILYDGHYLTYDRTNTNSGKKYYRCTRSYCKVKNVMFMSICFKLRLFFL